MGSSEKGGGYTSHGEYILGTQYPIPSHTQLCFLPGPVDSVVIGPTVLSGKCILKSEEVKRLHDFVTGLEFQYVDGVEVIVHIRHMPCMQPTWIQSLESHVVLPSNARCNHKSSTKRLDILNGME